MKKHFAQYAGFVRRLWGRPTLESGSRIDVPSNQDRNEPVASLLYNGGEIVRLICDPDWSGVRKGDLGVVWGVYATSPPFYEATFLGAEDEYDVPFGDEAVEVVEDLSDVPNAARLIELAKVYGAE